MGWAEAASLMCVVTVAGVVSFAYVIMKYGNKS